MITTITTLLASTTFIVWGTIIFLVLMTVLLEFEQEGWATTFFSLGMALWIWNFGCEIWGYVSAIIWSIFKWTTYVKEIFNKAKVIKDKFNLPSDVKTTDKIWKDFIEELNDSTLRINKLTRFYSSDTFETIGKKIASSSDKKSVITSWIAYWPVSLAGTLLNNPFRRFFEMLYASISGLYDKISNHYQKNAFGK